MTFFRISFHFSAWNDLLLIRFLFYWVNIEIKIKWRWELVRYIQKASNKRDNTTKKCIYSKLTEPHVRQINKSYKCNRHGWFLCVQQRFNAFIVRANFSNVTANVISLFVLFSRNSFSFRLHCFLWFDNRSNVCSAKKSTNTYTYTHKTKYKSESDTNKMDELF